MTTLRDRVESLGYATVDPLLDPSTCDELVAHLQLLPPQGDRRRGGVRNLFARVPLIRELVRSEPIRNIVEQVLSPDAVAVRSLLFDKTPRSNWHVPWHQDRTIAVNQRSPVPGFGPWSEKHGVVHVQPPLGGGEL